MASPSSTGSHTCIKTGNKSVETILRYQNKGQTRNTSWSVEREIGRGAVRGGCCGERDEVQWGVEGEREGGWCGGVVRGRKGGTGVEGEREGGRYRGRG